LEEMLGIVSSPERICVFLYSGRMYILPSIGVIGYLDSYTLSHAITPDIM
jgi:hypothetical protein